MNRLAEKITRPALRYHGGKFRLAPWVIQHFPPHRIYCEPYGGAASVLLQKPRCYAEIYNDQWDEVVNLFHVLRDPAASEALTRQLYLTPFARREFQAAYEFCPDPIERARRLVIRSYMGHGSAGANAARKTGFRNDSNRSGTTPTRDWMNFPSCLAAITNRLRGVCIENKPALEVIAEFDTPETLFYADPPYPFSTRTANARANHLYEFEMDDADHRDLAKVLHQAQGMVIVSGYACPLYDEELYPDWTRAQKTAFADGAAVRTECLWLNPKAAGNIQASLDL